MGKPPIKYNPAFLTDDELIEAFVVRESDLELVLQVVRENTTASNQHVLIVGPRGIGKTMLVRRVAAEIRRDKCLQLRWYPIIFAEESYEVCSAGEFWLEAIAQLAYQTGDSRWGATYEELKGETNDAHLRERCLAQLMEFADERSSRLLLIVENLNMLLGEQVSHDDAWSLRHTLMHEPRVMLLATATTRFEATENAGRAMFELFKMHSLPPLSEDECRDVWRAIAGEDIGDRRIRAVRILTGGNPRLLTIISHFGARLSFRNLMEDMTHLVDEHTEYFKSHLDSLPRTERKVYATLATLWDPSTASQVAEASRLGVSKTSALLGRLRERGAVAQAEGKGRSKRYQVAERMYNIYYLMRRRGTATDRVKAVVRFMVNFYDDEGLVRVASLIAEEACSLTSDSRQDHYEAFEWIYHSSPAIVRSRLLECMPRGFLEATDAPTSIRPYTMRHLVRAESADVPFAFSAPEHARTASCGPHSHPDERVQELMREAATAARREPRDPDKVEQAIRAVIAEDQSYADAWLQLGLLLEHGKKRKREAEKAYQMATSVSPDYACAWSFLARHLGRSKRRAKEALQAARRAIDLCPECSHAWYSLGRILERRKGTRDEATAAYRRCTELSPSYVMGWLRLGDILSKQAEHVDEAEQAYRRAIEVQPADPEAWSQLGRLLHRQTDRYQEAEDAYRKVIEIKPDSPTAWLDLGDLLENQLRRYDDAEEAYRRVTESFPDFPYGWAMLGSLLHRYAGDFGEAEAAYRKALELNSDFHWAWEQLGRLLAGPLGRHEEAEAAYDAAMKSGPDCRVVWMLRGELCERTGRAAEAETAYRRAVDVSPDYDAAWARLGRLLSAALGRHDEAEKAFRRALELRPDSAWTWAHFGDLLCEHLRQYTEAEAAYRKAAELEPDRAYTWCGLGVLLDTKLGRPDEAENAFRKATEVQPDYHSAWEALGGFLAERRQDPVAALEALEKALDVGRSCPYAWLHVCRLLLAKLGKVEESLRRAEESLTAVPNDARLLNGLAWTFYEEGPPRYLPYAEAWSREAVSIDGAPGSNHTLACILARNCKTDEALSIARSVLEQDDFCANHSDDIVHLFSEFVGTNSTRGGLRVLEQSKSSTLLEPLAVALHAILGDPVTVAAEIREVAADVRKRIEELVNKQRQRTVRETEKQTPRSTGKPKK